MTALTHQPRALPIVLLHGMRVSGAMWAPLRANLGDDRARRSRLVSSPDLPGHGGRKDEPFTMDDAIAACRDEIVELGGKALLVGHSLGGFVAFATAAEHPELVAGVVAIGASTRPTGVGLAAYRAYARFLAADPIRGARFSDAAARRALPNSEFEAWTSGGYSNENAPGVVEAVASRDPLDDLRGYGGPVWLLNGSLDQLRLGEKGFAALPNVRLSVWPGLNHLSVVGRTERLATFITDAAIVSDHDR